MKNIYIYSTYTEYKEIHSWGIIGLKPQQQRLCKTLVLPKADYLILLLFLLYDIQSSQETTENLGLAAVFHLCFWICRNLIYLMTVLHNLLSILCTFLVDEETFVNCMQSAGSLLPFADKDDSSGLHSLLLCSDCWTLQTEIFIFFTCIHE